jgi:hypothetical protein
MRPFRLSVHAAGHLSGKTPTVERFGAARLIRDPVKLSASIHLRNPQQVSQKLPAFLSVTVPLLSSAPQ